MNKLIFFVFIITGCVLHGNKENFRVIKIPSNPSHYDSNYYEFTNSGKIIKDVTYQDSAYSGPIKTIVEFSKKGRIVSETQIIYKFSMINKNIYYNDKFNSLKLQETYQYGKLNGYSYGYFKQDSVNQKNQIIFSIFFYKDNKLAGEGYFFYKNGAVREKHYYYAGNENTIEFYDKNGKFKGVLMTDSIFKVTHPK